MDVPEIVHGRLMTPNVLGDRSRRSFEISGDHVPSEGIDSRRNVSPKDLDGSEPLETCGHIVLADLAGSVETGASAASDDSDPNTVDLDDLTVDIAVAIR